MMGHLGVAASASNVLIDWHVRPFFRSACRAHKRHLALLCSRHQVLHGNLEIHAGDGAICIETGKSMRMTLSSAWESRKPYSWQYRLHGNPKIHADDAAVRIGIQKTMQLAMPSAWEPRN